MRYKVFVNYKGKETPLLLAAKDLGVEPISAMCRLRLYMKRNNTTLQEEFDKLIERHNRMIERREYIDKIYSQLKDDGVTRECVKQRLYKNFDEDRMLYRGNLKIFNGAKPKNHYKVLYNGESLGFKTAVRKATDGKSIVDFSALSRCKIYKDMTPQEAFNLFIKRWKKKWGVK